MATIVAVGSRLLFRWMSPGYRGTVPGRSLLQQSVGTKWEPQSAGRESAL